MFLFSGSTSCLFIFASVGRCCFLIWIFFSCSSSFLVFFFLDFVAWMILLLLCWCCKTILYLVQICVLFFLCSVCDCLLYTLILWWHLMCHVVHYHYQHVFSFSSWLLMPFSPDLLAASVFVKFLSCIPAWRFIHSRTRIKWCVEIFLLKNC